MQNKKNIPQLRFPKFKGEWKRKKLGEVTNYTKGFAFKSSNYVSDGIRVVRVSDLGKDDIKREGDKIFILKDELENYTTYLLEKGDIIITTVGSKPELLESAVGRGIYINNENEGLLNQNMLKLNNNKVVSNKFISCLINTTVYIAYITSIQRGNANQSNIAVKDLLEYNIALPSLPEQTRIASFFTIIDKKISELKQKKILLEQYKKGIIQKIFSQEVRFKDANNKMYSKWEQKNLGDITIKVDKKNKNREILPVFSINNINGFVPQSEQFEGVDSNDRGYDISLYKIIENNTFAYNPARINVGSIGYSGTIGRVIISSLYVCFKTVETVNDMFFNYYLNTSHFRNSVLRNGEGGVRIYLFYENFSEITINLPSLAEQIKIANFLSIIDEKINRNQLQIEKTIQYKKGLLQMMFC